MEQLCLEAPAPGLRWLDLLAVEWRARRLLIRGAEARACKAALASGAMDLRCPREDAVWLALPQL